MNVSTKPVFPKDIPLSQGQSIANTIAKQLRGGEILGLTGNLGSGKTSFTKHLCAALGYDDNVSSPTFAIWQHYQLPNKTKNPIHTIHHLDLYRLDNVLELNTIGITDFWTDPHSLTIIEWADKFPQTLPSSTIFLNCIRDVSTV